MRCSAATFSRPAAARLVVVRPGGGASAAQQHDEYKPGNRLTLDLGVRYERGDRVALMLQLNALFKARDSGAEAEPRGQRRQVLVPQPRRELRVRRKRAGLRLRASCRSTST